MKQAQTPEVLLSLEDYRIERGQHFSLRHINWSVRQGEHWCILGPNGCGKTSLLSSITAYSPASGGIIRMFGEVYGDCEWQIVRQQVGIVSTGLLPYVEESEIAEELVITGKYAWLTNWGSISRADRLQARALLKQLDCAKISRSTWSTLSQGERQRVLIARALMAPIKLLILDEPCSGLDPIARHHFLNRVELLAQQKNAPAQIMVTHHIEEVIPSCTHVLLIGKDGIVAQGPKHKVLNSAQVSEAYQHPIRVRKNAQRFSFIID